MTWRSGFLLAVLVSLVLWLLVYLLVVTGWRAVHETTQPSTRVRVASEGRAFMFDMDSLTSAVAIAHSHPPKPVARTGPIRVSSASPAGAIPDLIRRVFARFGPDVAEQAVRVSFCESRHNPAATNGQHASLFQVSRTYHEDRARRLGFTWDRMWDPEVNSLVAADIYASSGWQPWTCRHAA